MHTEEEAAVEGSYQRRLYDLTNRFPPSLFDSNIASIKLEIPDKRFGKEFTKKHAEIVSKLLEIAKYKREYVASRFTLNLYFKEMIEYGLQIRWNLELPSARKR